MLDLHPYEESRNGEKVVVLLKTEYLDLREMAEDYQDLLDLEKAIKKNADDPGEPYSDFRKTLGIRI
jgi:hypothetical protein